MSKPVFSAKRSITLADDDVILINGLPVTKQFISIISNLVQYAHSPADSLYEIADALVGMMEVNQDDQRFSAGSAYILWYAAQLLREHDRIIRKEGGGNE